MIGKPFKKYLRGLEYSQLKDLCTIAKLSDLEYWVIIYGSIEKRLVDNTCMKLSISRAYYFMLQNRALLKLYFTIKKF